MLKFIYWLLGIDKVYLPEHYPEDDWERMFLLAEVATSIKLPTITDAHFDVSLITYTDNVNELFFRLDSLITCMTTGGDAPKSWRARRRDVIETTLADYYYDVRAGYRVPQTVLETLLQKLSVIHYLYDTKLGNPLETYSIYLRKNFSGVIRDVNEVLETSISIRIT